MVLKFTNADDTPMRILVFLPIPVVTLNAHSSLSNKKRQEIIVDKNNTVNPHFLMITMANLNN